MTAPKRALLIALVVFLGLNLLGVTTGFHPLRHLVLAGLDALVLAGLWISTRE